MSDPIAGDPPLPVPPPPAVPATKTPRAPRKPPGLPESGLPEIDRERILDPDRFKIDIRSHEPPEAPEAAERAHAREMRSMAWRGGLAAGLMASAVILFIAALAFGKPELAEKVVATAIGALGGFGFAKATEAK